MAKLELLVDSYSPPNLDDPNVPLPEITKGELFEPVSAQERDRLLNVGAAADPAEAQKQREQALEREREQIEARRAVLDAELEELESGGNAGPLTAESAQDLKGKDLDSALSQRGLSTEGKADEKRARLSEALAAES